MYKGLPHSTVNKFQFRAKMKSKCKTLSLRSFFYLLYGMNILFLSKSMIRYVTAQFTHPYKGFFSDLFLLCIVGTYLITESYGNALPHTLAAWMLRSVSIFYSDQVA